MNNLIVTILAGGVGKRMKSDIPKVLHKVHNTPMLIRIIQQSIKLDPIKIIIVVGKFKNIIKNSVDFYIADSYYPITFVDQYEPLGTGDAVKQTLECLDNDSYNLILNGDTPLISYDLLKKIQYNFLNNNYDLQITSINLFNPTGNGRIIKNNGVFEKITEEKDCNEQEKEITEVNVGIYVCSCKLLCDYIPKITNNNMQNEYYLTDLVDICSNNNQKIGLYQLDSKYIREIMNINTPEQLLQANII
jgi:bifunctional N-acetylglucosamine-1-phosphate-uridyltransferase/glucosamine-1-phosphate-acetyltransferase GlmU-like protein